MVKGKDLIYIRNTNCAVCGSQVIYYSTYKKLTCDCGDREYEISPELLGIHFKPLKVVLQSILQEKEQ